MPSGILWMHDLSDRADAAASAVLRLSTSDRASAVVAHATGHLDPAGAVGRDARARFERIAEDLREEGLHLTPVVRAGSPVDLMHKLVAERGLELVVFGRTGVSGFDRVLLGSTAAKLVREAPCPALVVHETGLAPLDRIVCAIDPHEPAPAVVAAAARLACSHSAQLDIVTVVEAGSGKEDMENARRVAESALRDHAPCIPDRWTASAQVGETALHGILVASRGAALLVVGTHGRTGLARFLTGSVAEGLIDEAKTSVLVVP